MNGTPPAAVPPVRKPRRRWRWHVPPALLHGPEALEGAEVLDEVPAPLSLLLWQSMRDVTLWASVPEPEERADLFHASAAADREALLRELHVDATLEPALHGIARMLADPAGTDEAALLDACQQVSTWADSAGYLATALAFSQAAAIAAPAHAAAGYRVGVLARRRADYARAETWFRRTIGLGRQSKDWKSYAEAFLGLGNLYVQRGNFPAARRFHVRALRAARRHGMRDIQAASLHDLFGIAVESGELTQARDHARAAFRAYGARNPRLPRLAHDLAYFWMMHGRFEAALSVFQAILPHLSTRGERLLARADIARAAGGAGNRAVFEDTWGELWGLAHEPAHQEHAAQALLDLAHGATSLGEWKKAEMAAGAALEAGRRREENRVVMAAEAVLESARAKRAMELKTAKAAPAESEEETEGFAAELVRSLSLVPAGG
jgi:tetratricopeptide (TPR) repeat protein